ncbi:MAG: AbrB/MazE/SpoVT family DNA-binding domain-containing protein [Verrucomicrobia bacterium]|nr:AbrB/MazE/SpoVT family DNA-binding domain-containing protein [Verrucomicrobiota bacterium]
MTKKRQVILPAEICEALGITPGARLEFRARNGKLEAVKLPPVDSGAPVGSLKHLYTPERNAEELALQQGCSCEVPEDFPK